MSLYILIFLFFEVFWSVLLFTALDLMPISPVHHKHRRIFRLLRVHQLYVPHLQVRVLRLMLLCFLQWLGHVVLSFEFVRFLLREIFDVPFIHNGFNLELLFGDLGVILLLAWVDDALDGEGWWAPNRIQIRLKIVLLWIVVVILRHLLEVVRRSDRPDLGGRVVVWMLMSSGVL